MARRCFYSFHYERDAARAAQVRNVGVIEGNRPASDNDWHAIASGGEAAIRRWIASQLDGRSCTVVLVGTHTANRPWINHEIVESWNRGMGVVGIRIHGLKNLDELVSNAGGNPFDFISQGPSGKKLSMLARCYDPAGTTSKERYAWIAQYLSAAVEEAIEIRKASD